MILEGFVIDNWSCIKHLSVEALPTSGVIVLHGPNGTGKSSIVEALRACLMDYKSTSKAIDRAFSKRCPDKPRVSVTFRAKGVSWRITKQFNSKESRLESKSPLGQWKLETSDPTEAHDRTRELTGGCDSNLGLYQLLWLTQAEFRLPKPRDFDADVQSRLRAVLGVLQTNLDDLFIGRVKEQWSRWFSARTRPGEKGKRKRDCQLEKDLERLTALRAELAKAEQEFQAFERLMVRSRELEIEAFDLRRQQQEKAHDRDALQEEYERSLARIEDHRRAAKQLEAAEEALKQSKQHRQTREAVERFIADTQSLAEAARQDVEAKTRQLEAAERSLEDLRIEVREFTNDEREKQARLNAVADRRQVLAAGESLKAARQLHERVTKALNELDGLKKEALARPAPDSAAMKGLESNRTRATQLRADMAAAAISVTLEPAPGAAWPTLTIDGHSEKTTVPANRASSIHGLIRRDAQIDIPGWGKARIQRGSDARDLDEIENELGKLDRQFATEAGSFGVVAEVPTALDQLRNRAAEKKLRDPDLKRRQEEIDRLAPKGLEPIEQEITRLENLLGAIPNETHADLPTDRVDLDRLADRLKADIGDIQKKVSATEDRILEAERSINGSAGPPGAKSSKPIPASTGYRQEKTAAEQKLVELNVAINLKNAELQRLLTADQIEADIQQKEASVAMAQKELQSAKLSENEETIRERLNAAIDSVRAIDERLAETQREFHNIEGALRLSEGLHQKRAAAAARVEELAQNTEREALESEACDRLYALFEECREKQLGAVMGPIHDRVVRWMRLLRIGGYQSIRFNDQFLPESLHSGDGETELALDEESTGTIEQLGLMVRLALGGTLSDMDEPVTTILDDPLTHSDVNRLNLMRAVLKNAAGGDPGCRPPAGPMQILVFTCHPEWFVEAGGPKPINLGSHEVLQRFG